MRHAALLIAAALLGGPAATAAAAPPAFTGGPLQLASPNASIDQVPLLSGHTVLITAEREIVTAYNAWTDDDSPDVTTWVAVTDLDTGQTTRQSLGADVGFGTDLAEGPGGEVLLALTTRSPHRVVLLTRPAHGTFAITDELETPDPELGNGIVLPRLAVNAGGEAVVMVTAQDVAGGVTQNYAAFRKAPGASFGALQPIGPREAIGVLSHHVTLDDAGVAVAEWRHIPREATTGTIYASTGSRGTAFTAPEALSTPGRDADADDLHVTPAGEAVAVWREGDPRVYHDDNTFTQDETGTVRVARHGASGWSSPKAIDVLGDEGPGVRWTLGADGRMTLVTTGPAAALEDRYAILEGTAGGAFTRVLRASQSWEYPLIAGAAGHAAVVYRTYRPEFVPGGWYASAQALFRSGTGSWEGPVDTTDPCREVQPMDVAMGADGTLAIVALQTGPDGPNPGGPGLRLVWTVPSAAPAAPARCSSFDLDAAQAPEPSPAPPGTVAPSPSPSPSPSPVLPAPAPFAARFAHPRLVRRADGRAVLRVRYACSRPCGIDATARYAARHVRSFVGGRRHLAAAAAGRIDFRFTRAARRRLGGHRRWTARVRVRVRSGAAAEVHTAAGRIRRLSGSSASA